MHRSARFAALAFAVLGAGPTATFAASTVRPDAVASVVRSINPHVTLLTSRSYAVSLLDDSKRMHLDPRLVMAVVTAESGWNARAVSPDGALGLGQFTPETARYLHVDPWSGRSTLRGVAVYLHRLLGMFASSRNAMRSAIASYNAGPYAVKAAGGRPPSGETSRYVTRVFALWHSFKRRLSPTPTPVAVAVALDEAQTAERDQAAYWGAH